MFFRNSYTFSPSLPANLTLKIVSRIPCSSLLYPLYTVVATVMFAHVRDPSISQENPLNKITASCVVTSIKSVQEKDAIALIKSESVHPACLELAITEGVRKRRLFTPESLISQGPRDRSLLGE